MGAEPVMTRPFVCGVVVVEVPIDPAKPQLVWMVALSTRRG